MAAVTARCSGLSERIRWVGLSPGYGASPSPGHVAAHARHQHRMAAALADPGEACEQQEQAMKLHVSDVPHATQSLNPGGAGRPSSLEARKLTVSICAAEGASQMLDILVAHSHILDCIHVSAAIRHATRTLRLELNPPPAMGSSAAVTQPAPELPGATAGSGGLQQQQQQQWSDGHLVWLQQLRLDEKQLQQRAHKLAQLGADGDSEQSTSHADWAAAQQLQPAAALAHALAAAPVESAFVQLPAADADSWQLLLLLCDAVTQHANDMVSQQLCTCANGVAHLLSRHPELPLLSVPAARRAMRALLRAAQRQMPELQPRALAVLLHAAAAAARSRGGVAPSAGWLRDWLRASGPTLGSFTPLDLSMSAWALGRLRVYPPTQWLAAFWAHSKAAIPQLQQQELLLLVAGMAYVEPRPRAAASAAAARAGWGRAAAEALQSALPSMTPQQLSLALLALAKLGHEPGAAWLNAFTLAWEALAPDASAKAHSMVLWGVGSLPGSQLLGVSSRSSSSGGSSSSSSGGSRPVTTQQSNAAGSPGTPDPVLQGDVDDACSLLQQPGGEAPSDPPLTPQQQARLAMARRVQAALQTAVTRAASAVAAVAVLKLRQAAQRQQQQQQQQHLDQQQPIQQPVQQPVQQPAAAPPSSGEQPQLLAGGSLLHPADCAMCISALARLGPGGMGPGFAAFWLRQAAAQQRNMNSAELASCLWALGRLRLRPPADWLAAHLEYTRQLAPCMNHKQLAMTLWGCARLQYLPNVLASAALLTSAAEQMSSFTPHSLSLVAWSLGALRLRPSNEWMALLLRQSRRRFMRFEGADFAGLLLGLHWLGFRPAPAWLDALTQALAAKVHLVPPNKHALCVALLRTLGYTGEGRQHGWVMDEGAVAEMCGRAAR